MFRTMKGMFGINTVIDFQLVTVLAIQSTK